jgi:hypothetical protein
MFSTNFNIDRETLTKIICQKYHSSTIDKARFDSSRYQGIKSKYISRIGCSVDCTSTGPKKSKCPCKKLSFLIFQRQTMVTGARRWDQIIDGFNTIKNIIINEYEDIRINNSSETSPKQNDPIETKLFDNKYLNSRLVIFENPRNAMLLKTAGLLEYYRKICV